MRPLPGTGRSILRGGHTLLALGILLFVPTAALGRGIQQWVFFIDRTTLEITPPVDMGSRNWADACVFALEFRPIRIAPEVRVSVPATTRATRVDGCASTERELLVLLKDTVVSVDRKGQAIRWTRNDLRDVSRWVARADDRWLLQVGERILRLRTEDGQTVSASEPLVSSPARTTDRLFTVSDSPGENGTARVEIVESDPGGTVLRTFHQSFDGECHGEKIRLAVGASEIAVLRECTLLD